MRPDPVLDFASWILWEDQWLVAVDKPAGVLSQGGEGGAGKNVVDLARAHLKKEGIGVLHRIDRNVSGVVLVAKEHGIASAMTKLFAEGKVERVYRAIVKGHPKEDAFVIDAPLDKDRKTNEVRVSDAGRPARTDVVTVRRFTTTIGACAELDVRPITGRSHQIRVHLAHAGFPILGDPKYGVPMRGVNRPLLHAMRIAFVHPRTRKKIEIEAPIPWEAFA